MSMTKYVLSILLLISFENLRSYTDAINCEPEGEYCTFSNVTTKESNLLFYPSATNTNSVKKIKFVNSSLYALTNELCEKFKNLDDLRMENVSLQTISNNALTKCSKLYVLVLNNNRLKQIPGEAFEGLTGLSLISLSNNELVHFPIHKMPRMTWMTTLKLDHNRLVDLDPSAIKKQFENLKSCTITGNRFDCDRLWSILDIFDVHNVEYIDKKSEVKLGNGKGNINGIGCLTDEDRFKAVLDSSLAPIVEDIVKVKETQIELQEAQQELLETQEHLQAEVKNLTELTKNMSLVIHDMDVAFQIATDEVRQAVRDINETFVVELKDFEMQVVDILNSKEDFSKRIYYASIAVLSIITFISVIVIGTLISLIWGSTKSSVNDKSPY